MSWEALGAIGELVGAVAVLITLIYLAVQVRHGRDLLEEHRKIALSQVYTERTNQRLEDIRQSLSNPDLLNVVAEERDLEPEVLRRRMINQQMELQIDNMLYQDKLGLLEPMSLAMAEERVRTRWAIWKERGCVIHPYVQEWHDKSMSDGA